METTVVDVDINKKFEELLLLEPKIVSSTVPSNALEQKNLFLSGNLDTPAHIYPKLRSGQDKLPAILAIGLEIANSSNLDKKHASVYESFVDDYVKKTRLMQAMNNIKSAPSESERSDARTEFMKLNIELYGEPDKDTYTSLLSEKLGKIFSKELSPSGEVVRQELSVIVEHYLCSEAMSIERFAPSHETVQWMHNATETLYSSFLSHIPDQDFFSVNEVRDIFSSIIEHEFGEAAKDWRVDVEPAKSINVKAAERRVVIPEDRGELGYDELRKLAVHELGVHVLRSITGEQTNVNPLRIGLSGYYDSEEGLGKVMEQALNGVFKEGAGVDHYITAGAAYHDNLNFRDTFELKWRIGALEKLKDGEELSEDAITKAKATAYGQVMRIFRGTDELPLFKDLAYYNGTTGIWKFLNDIRGDDFRLTLLLMGKVDTNSKHLRTILESRTV